MKWAFFAPTVLCDTRLYPNDEWGMSQNHFPCISCSLHYFAAAAVKIGSASEIKTNELPCTSLGLHFLYDYRREDRRRLGNKNK